MKAISAVYQNGAFHPLSPVELPEQTNVFVMLPQVANESKDVQAILNTAGAWADIPGIDDILEQLEDMRRSATYRD